MSKLNKYGCILQAIDLDYVTNEIHKTNSASSIRTNSKQTMGKQTMGGKQNIYKTIKLIDFFLQNEIKVINTLNYNHSITATAYLNEQYSHYLNTFSSFVPIKMSILKIPSYYLSNSSTTASNSNAQKHGSFNYDESIISCPKLLRYISGINNPNSFILSLITIFKSALNNLSYLKINELVHLDMSVDTISINQNDERVLMGNVKFLFLVNDLKEETILRKIITNSEACASFSAPIEQILLMHLFKNNLNSVSKYDVTTIISSYLAENAYLNKMPSSFKDDYTKHCENTMMKYVNASKLAIIENVLKECNTWNIFSLSMIYLNIIMYLQSICENICKQGFLNKWMKILILNTHPDPKKRKTVEDTASIFAKLCYNNPINEFKGIIALLTPENMSKIAGF